VDNEHENELDIDVPREGKQIERHRPKLEGNYKTEY
jgi:hypothetical protein